MKIKNFKFVKVVCAICLFFAGLILLSACNDNSKDNLYKINFFNDGDSCIEVEVKENQLINLANYNKPIKVGYVFDGWYDNTDCEGEEISAFIMPSNSVNLYAKWQYEYSNLPVMEITLNNTNLSDVSKEQYVNSTISIFNTSKSFEINNVACEFKGRGNSSWEMDKKGYKLKFNKKQSLFGHPSNKHWTLNASASCDDLTICRNYLAYNMANEVFTEIEYCTSAEFLDLYINNEYRGVYVLCEHVRVDSNRVNIKSEFGVENTGYLIEYDGYCSWGGVEQDIDYFEIEGLKYGFTVHSPSPEDYEKNGLTKEEYKAQVLYIKNYVEQVYNAVFNNDFETFCELADINSFVDMYLLHELFKNADTGWSSFYLYKKPDGKLYAGPPWDFDATANIYGRGDRSPQGIYVAHDVLFGSEFSSSELYIELYKNSNFLNIVKQRWNVISKELDAFVQNYLSDDFIKDYKMAMGRNFALWYNLPQEQAQDIWSTETLKLKQWLLDRINWLNDEWSLTSDNL